MRNSGSLTLFEHLGTVEVAVLMLRAALLMHLQICIDSSLVNIFLVLRNIYPLRAHFHTRPAWSWYYNVLQSFNVSALHRQHLHFSPSCPEVVTGVL
jgi:hypothetical protein